MTVEVSSRVSIDQLQQVAAQIRRWILEATTDAGSGHPTSSLSAVELMTALMFGGFFRYDPTRPEYLGNDRLIFSKGHASPLLYALWAAAGEIEAEALHSYRSFGSELEGHPTSRFRFAEAATGSLGQGLGIGVGMALAAKYLDELPFRTFVLLGDSEMSEGSQWEAIQLAAHYKLDSLIGILDVNRLGQRGETMYGHDLVAYRDRIASFGWRCIMVDDGHDLPRVMEAYAQAMTPCDQPTMLIAWTVKGKGVSLLENQDDWHGKPLDPEQLSEALQEIDAGDVSLPISITPPPQRETHVAEAKSPEPMTYALGDPVATRDAYGNALKRLAGKYPQLVALDGEVCNSTRSKVFREAYPHRFIEMFIAEQTMVSAATGLALRGKHPFVSTFAAFMSRAFDQIRMAPYCDVSVKFVGSHCGVSVGQDGPSQMGLEDIAMFRTLGDGVVLYPSDAVSTEQLVDALASHHGIGYLRTTRGKTPVLYSPEEAFPIGGSKVLRQSEQDRISLVAAGITLHAALQAHETLKSKQIMTRVIDLYSIKPLDHATLRRAAEETETVFTIEDHFPEGGLGEAVLTSLSDHPTPIHCLAVRKRPLSGTTEELLDFEGISAQAIVAAVEQKLHHGES